jgi:hypothetical protein
MLHLEPDCLVTGRLWRENLLRAIEQGAWMAGANRKPWGPIHPTPSAWLIRQVSGTFKGRPMARDIDHPRFQELVDLDVLEEQAREQGCWEWARTRWDTADRAWFSAAIHDRAALVEAPDFRHFWLGSQQHALSQHQLVAKFPELATWFARSGPECRPQRPEDCSFRRDVRSDGGIEIASCGLLREISGVVDSRLCEVRRDVCQACCESVQPSRSVINAVLASRLYRLADGIIGRGGVDGCDEERASDLRFWAEERLEIRLPGEGSPPVHRRTECRCFYLGGELGARIRATASGHDRLPVYHCRHPDHIETTMAECRRCRDWAKGPSQGTLPIEHLVPPPASRWGRRVAHWAVGVTTAPRPQPTLHACLDSLLRAGWEGPRLFVDSAVTVPDRFSDLPVTFHETRLGAWPNYYLGLVELLMREPEADAFMLVQDDVVFDDRHPLREYLEEILWPADPVAAVSLFCSSPYAHALPGWHEFEGRWVLGALAFVFPPESAKRFVTDRTVFEHRSDRRVGLFAIDIEVGRWAHAHHLPIYFPTPSLVQHIGDTSSLWTDGNARAMGRRRASRFTGNIEETPSEK